MHVDILTEARRVAQEFGLKIIPCGSRKQPLLKGWRNSATDDPQEEDFRAATYVGVPAGIENDLIVFDLDFYKKDENGVPQPAEPEIWDQLAAFEEELLAAYPGQVRVHETQSGGVHLIMLNPAGKTIARSPMPNLEIISEGFQFIWPTAGSGYKVVEDVALDDLAEPDERFLKVRIKSAGVASSSGRMTDEEAHEILMSDGKLGSRHDAVLRLTTSMLGTITDDHMQQMTDVQIAKVIQNHLIGTYGPSMSEDRAEELFRVTYERDGSLSTVGELSRAIAKPLAERRKALHRQEVGPSLYQQQLDKVKERGGLLVTPAAGRVKDAQEQAVEATKGRVTKRAADVTEEVHPWLLPGFIRERGTMVVVGMSSVGKTTLSAGLIACMLAGRTDVLGFEAIARPLNVMWLNAEEEESSMLKHVEAAEYQHGLRRVGELLVMGEDILNNPDEPHGADLVYEAPDPDTGRIALQVNTSMARRLQQEIEESKIDILIVDPITEFNGGNEDKRYDARMLNRVFRTIAVETGCACVFWAHTGKPPESKRPDWYKDDIFAQRGSSQNTGATQGAATLTPMISHKLTKAQMAWEAWKAARNGEGRNLILLNTVKMKRYKTLPRTAFEILPSDLDEDYPVAMPMDLDEALDLVATDTSANARLDLIHTTQEIVKRLGVGRHGRIRAEKLLNGCLGVKTLRPTQKAAEEVLRKWKRGVKVAIDDREYMVTAVYEAGKSGVDFEVLNVTE
jgi:hypothetical protein